MIVVGSSLAPRQPRARIYPHGLTPAGTAGNWITGYMGRELRDPLNPVNAPVLPDSDTIYPMAYLVEQDANSSLRPHFHVADQFQVVVDGGGRLGGEPIGSVTFHFVSPHSAYGPIEAGPEGIHYITLRNRYDPGSRFMPESRRELPPPPRQYRQVIGGPVQPLPPDDLVALKEQVCREVVAPESDGLAAWHCLLPPGQVLEPIGGKAGDGRHLLVLGGGLRLSDGTVLTRNSCVFLSADETGFPAEAGETGLELLVLQYPVRTGRASPRTQ